MRDYQYVVTLDVVNSDSLKKIEKDNTLATRIGKFYK